MAVKLRLLRKGRKKKPFYYIVAADARAPRDGRFIERIGSYNPNTNPATIDLDLDGSVRWLQNGAQPTDTVRAILSYKGAMHKNHLLKGAAKGAFPEEEVETRFNNWLSEKEGRVQAKRDQLADAKAAAEKEVFERESKIREEREKAILAKNSPLAEEVEGEVAAEGGEEAVAETTEEVAEAPAAEATETTEEAPAEEAPAEEAKEESTEE
ncbi:MAG: 30S ribosomal protein S16 [Bacteroidia bacterium]|nr:30S ribosomal protein S16 [Bacteroidia bacterium]